MMQEAGNPVQQAQAGPFMQGQPDAHQQGLGGPSDGESRAGNTTMGGGTSPSPGPPDIGGQGAGQMAAGGPSVPAHGLVMGNIGQADGCAAASPAGRVSGAASCGCGDAGAVQTAGQQTGAFPGAHPPGAAGAGPQYMAGPGPAPGQMQGAWQGTPAGGGPPHFTGSPFPPGAPFPGAYHSGQAFAGMAGPGAAPPVYLYGPGGTGHTPHACGHAPGYDSARGPGHPKHDAHQHGQWLGLINDLANGDADASRVMAFLDSLDTRFWKGALVGVAATLLLTNESVKQGIVGALSGLWGVFQSEPQKQTEE